MGRPPRTSRDEIRNAARQLFLERGVQGTSLRDVARAVGVDKATLYYHFTSRSDLVEAVIGPALAALEATITGLEAEPATSPEDVLGHYFDFHYEYRWESIVILRDLRALSDVVDDAFMIDRRRRLRVLLVGADASPACEIAAEVALGGLIETVLSRAHLSADVLREPVVSAAVACLASTAHRT